MIWCEGREKGECPLLPRRVLIGSTVLVVGFLGAVIEGGVRLGVSNEWEWHLYGNSATVLDLVLAAGGVALYSLFVAKGLEFWSGPISRAREVFALLSLWVAAVVIQAAVQSVTPASGGTPTWILALHDRVPGGYHLVARAEARDLATFLRGYPEWVRRQGATHLGTHPPGLIVVQSALLGALDAAPAVAGFVEDLTPNPVAAPLRAYGQNHELSQVDRSAILLTRLMTLAACAATVVPLFYLARCSLPTRSAWSVASLWPIVPSAVLFQPLAETAFPALSTMALALAAQAGRLGPRGGRFSALSCGIVLGLGMQFSLVFLAVGLIVAMILASASWVPGRERASQVLATGIGFLGLTGVVWAATRSSPFVIWWWVLKNNTTFYMLAHKTYWAWVLGNAIELAVALGIPATAWAAVALAWPRSVPRASLATAAVLIVLTLGGWNLSEVARLWLPFMPALLVAAGLSLDRCRATRATTAATAALLGIQTLAMQAVIQVIFLS